MQGIHVRKSMRKKKLPSVLAHPCVHHVWCARPARPRATAGASLRKPVARGGLAPFAPGRKEKRPSEHCAGSFGAGAAGIAVCRRGVRARWSGPVNDGKTAGRLSARGQAGPGRACHRQSGRGARLGGGPLHLLPWTLSSAARKRAASLATTAASRCK